jgi:PAS domain S-box-containing protein
MPADSPDRRRLPVWLSPTTLAVLIASLLTGLLGWIGLAAIHRMSTANLISQVDTDVDMCVYSLRAWLDEQRKVAVSWADEAGVRTTVSDFMNSPLLGDWDKDRVLASAELKELRTRLKPVCEAHGYVGFVVIDRQGRQVAALLDEALGNSLTGRPLETIRRAFDGPAVVTLPFQSDFALPEADGKTSTMQTTMLVATPVRNLQGDVVAVLAFRLRTANQFTEALESVRPGESGETYAFDNTGLLLTDSRFNPQLRELGLIPNSPTSRAVLQLQLRDPGGDLAAGFRSNLPRDSLPLTRMAKSATQKEDGADVSGYRDYRGTLVIGAWRWLPEYDFGVAHELDFNEAYSQTVWIRGIFFGWLAIFAGALVVSIGLHRRRQQAEQSRLRTQDALATLTNRLQVVLDSATQFSIIATDMSGAITVFNTGAERMLQYSASEMLGKTPAIIHSESEVIEHGEQLSRQFNRTIRGFDVFVEYARQGTYEERVWTYVRKDGSKLTVKLTVTALYDNCGEMTGFLGIATDVTESKRAEAALRHERFLMQTLLENLPDSIYFKDANSQFLKINKSLANRFGLSDPQAAVGKTDKDFFTIEHAEQAFADEQHLMKTMQPVIEKQERETWPDGHRTWVSTSKFPLRDENGMVAGTFGISRDITERKLADERFRLVVEASLNALLVVDQGGKIILLNSQTERLFGYSREELLGQSVELLVPPEVRGEHPSLRATYFKNPQTRSMGSGRELEGVRKDGSRVSIEIGLSPLETESGVFALASVVDITARKVFENSLRAAKEAAEATSRAKSDFLANMSHEIRTPMNAIIGMTELVLGTDLNRVQREYMTIVLESGETLLAIINEILDFSKIEAGKMKLESVDFDLRDLVGDAAKSLAVRAHNKDLELVYRISQEIPDLLVGDPVRLRQIIVNLLGNAIKFTEQGEILIDVSSVEQNENGVRLKFAVRDTGIGIEPDKQKLVFEAFTQSDTSTTRRFGGTGLGLAISSRLVTLFGSELELQSEVGKGSTFSFTILLPISKNAPATRVRVPADLLHATKVMIVDDNSTNRFILQEMVRGWGMIPLIAASGHDALEQLKLLATKDEFVPFVITDMHMPDMDGMMLVEHIRLDPQLARLSVIVLTSGDPTYNADHWETLGVATRLMKPVKQSELLSAIENVLSVDSQTHPRVEVKSIEDLPPVPPLRILLAEDGLTNQKLAMALLNKWGHNVTLAQDGREAVGVYQQQEFDLILMDVQMPEMDGLEATSHIRAMETKLGRRVPIIAMTARAMKGDRELCLDAGMDGYVSKPVRQRELYEAIAKHVKF